MSCTVDPVVDESAATLGLRGEVDLAAATVVYEAALDCLEQGCSHLAVDLSEVTFIDTAGMRVLARCHAEAAERGATFLVSGWSSTAERIAELLDVRARLTPARPRG